MSRGSLFVTLLRFVMWRSVRNSRASSSQPSLRWLDNSLRSNWSKQLLRLSRERTYFGAIRVYMRIATSSCVISSCDPLALRNWLVLRSYQLRTEQVLLFSIDTNRRAAQMFVDFPQVIGCQVPVVQALRS